MTEFTRNQTEAKRAAGLAHDDAIEAAQKLGQSVIDTLTPETAAALAQRAVTAHEETALKAGATGVANLLLGLKARIAPTRDMFERQWASAARSSIQWSRGTVDETANVLMRLLNEHIDRLIVNPWTDAFRAQGFFDDPDVPWPGAPKKTDFAPSPDQVKAVAHLIVAAVEADIAAEEAVKLDRTEAVQALWAEAVQKSGLDVGGSVHTAPPRESSE